MISNKWTGERVLVTPWAHGYAAGKAQKPRYANPYVDTDRLSWIEWFDGYALAENERHAVRLYRPPTNPQPRKGKTYD